VELVAEFLLVVQVVVEEFPVECHLLVKFRQAVVQLEFEFQLALVVPAEQFLLRVFLPAIRLVELAVAELVRRP
jgi:hypothetical protein